MKPPRKRIAAYMLSGVALYCGTYLVLSLLGQYEPAVWGLTGPKWYHWAPAGFVSDMRWRMPFLYGFLPLWEADRFLWHTADRAFSGRYPINLIAENESAAPGE